jgi:hypothetical protein
MVEPVQHGLSVDGLIGGGLDLEDRVAQGSTEAFEDRSLEQKVLYGLRLALEDLVGQVIEHKVVPTGKSGDKAVNVRSAASLQG